LPDLDGVAVIEGLRGWCTAPIIVLSARHEERAKVRALDAGADDYVTKPFGMDDSSPSACGRTPNNHGPNIGYRFHPDANDADHL
jgi:PleD family two-component response regulator